MKILVNTKQLKKIPYADKPLPQGGKIQHLSPEQFEEAIEAAKQTLTLREETLGKANKLTQDAAQKLETIIASQKTYLTNTI